MNKSNKLSLFYVLSSVLLFFALIGGGIYGIYISVGLSFVSNSVPESIDAGGISNVSFGGSVNYTPSMTGVIFLSIALIVISIFDFITLIKQIVFFKQYKLISNSTLEKKMEQKTKSKSSVVFWTILIDLISFTAGIVGLFINNNSFVSDNNVSWILYAIDVLVSILALLSIILLIAKLKNRKNFKPEKSKSRSGNGDYARQSNNQNNYVSSKDINQIEYNLIKLNAMKKGKIVSDDEYKKLRKKILNSSPKENIFDNTK